MEKKHVQRIVGVLVIIALAIVVMPLLFGRNDIPVQEEATNTKAPPFPDQANTATASNDTVAKPNVTSANSDANMQTTNSADMSANASQNINDAANMENTVNANLNADIPNSAPAAQPAKPLASSSSSATSPAAPAPSAAPTVAQADTSATPTLPVPSLDTIKKAEPTAADSKAPEQAAAKVAVNSDSSNAVSNDNATAKADDKKIAEASGDTSTDAASADTKPAPVKKMKIKKVKTATATKAKTLKTAAMTTMKSTKTAGWVVQMGSFSNKQNALRLSDKLRAAGFTVFTREMKSPSGKMSTRVYIGPEVKEASATKLSGKIHQKMNLQGIVMAYKPVAT